MKFRLKDRNTVVIDYHSESLVFNISPLAAAKVLYHADEPFMEINAYLSHLDSTKLDDIWQCYTEIKVALTEVFDNQVLEEELTNLITQIYAAMPYEDVEQYFRNTGGLVVPDEIKEDYSEQEMLRESTFLKEDYFKLICLAITLRPMVPIWGEYLSILRDTVGSKFKIYVAMRLLDHTNLMDTNPGLKLYGYVISRLSSDKPKLPTAVIDGLSSENLVDYLIANIVIRRLAIGDVQSGNDRRHLVSSIYAHFLNTVNNLNKREDKINDVTYRNDTDDYSLLERFKPRQQDSTGDLQISYVFAENPVNVALCIDPNINQKYVHASSRTFKSWGMQISKFHVTIVQWMLATAIPPRVVKTMPHVAILNCLAATQALLWQWEFYDLALMMSSEIDATETHINEAPVSRANQPQKSELDKYYPHEFTWETARQINPALHSINRLASGYRSRPWNPRIPDYMVDYHQTIRLDGTDAFASPPTLVRQLADLVIKLAKLSESLETQP